MSLSSGIRTEKVYHPEGHFDMNAVIDEMAAIEANDYKVSAIVMTTSQWFDMLKNEKMIMQTMPAEPESTTLFGAKIEIKDAPPWCIVIGEEY